MTKPREDAQDRWMFCPVCGTRTWRMRIHDWLCVDHRGTP